MQMSTNEKFQTAPHEAKMVWCSAQRTRVNPLDGTLLEDILLFAGDVEKTGYPPQFVRALLPFLFVLHPGLVILPPHFLLLPSMKQPSSPIADLNLFFHFLLRTTRTPLSRSTPRSPFFAPPPRRAAQPHPQPSQAGGLVS